MKIHERITMEIEGLFRRHTDAVLREEQSRREEYASFRENLEAKLTEGSQITLIGELWIFLGTFLSTMSNEIHCLIAGVPYFRM